MKYKPLYIKLEEYEKITSVLNSIKRKIGETQEKLRQIAELKAREEKDLKDLSERTNSMVQRLGEIETNLNSD